MILCGRSTRSIFPRDDQFAGMRDSNALHKLWGCRPRSLRIHRFRHIKDACADMSTHMAIVMAGLTWYAYHTTSKGVSSLTRWRGHEGKLSLLYLRVAHRSPKINSFVDATTITEKRCWTPIFCFCFPKKNGVCFRSYMWLRS